MNETKLGGSGTHPIAWMSAAWSVTVLSLLLAVVAVVNKLAPEAYMVCTAQLEARESTFWFLCRRKAGPCSWSHVAPDNWPQQAGCADFAIDP
jgi:hypothetical protein